VDKYTPLLVLVQIQEVVWFLVTKQIPNMDKKEKILSIYYSKAPNKTCG
jgi:hypothetical protein